MPDLQSHRRDSPDPRRRNPSLLYGQITIGNIRAAQRAGTKLVDIDYDFTGIATPCPVWLEISGDGGTTWAVPVTSAAGAVGLNVTPEADLRITWDAGLNWNGQFSAQTRFRVKASDLLPDPAYFAAIPAGNFQMGDALDGMTNAPVHTVNLTAYYIQKRGVTKAEWDAVRTWGLTNGYTDLAAGWGKAANHPVHGISWYNAVKWCNAHSEMEGLTPCFYKDAGQTVVFRTGTENIGNTMVKWNANGYRLPTEAEREKAARGGLAGQRFPWGDLISHANANFHNGGGETYQSGTTGYHPTYATGAKPFTSPVGSFAANGYGIFDIQVAEGKGWRDLARHAAPRGTWQDSDFPYVLAVPDASATKYRIVFENKQPLVVSCVRLSSTARSQDWRGQAGYALRSMERMEPPVQAREAWIRSADVVDLTGQMDAQGQLTWNAPAGRWTVVRFGHVNTGVKNKPAPPEATGFECDKLSAAGAELHFENYIGRLTKPGGPADGGRLQVMHIDSWECRTQTWTPAMEREFAARRGYPLRRWLPALAGWVMDDHRTSERFLRDWRANISDLLVDHYYGRMGELARARGLKFSCQSGPGDVSPGDILQYFSKADMPITEFWQPNDPNDGGIETKPIAPTASAVHIYRKTRLAAESFTSIPLAWDNHPFALKNFADRAFARGVTHILFHTYTHNPLDHVPGSSFGRSIGTPFLRGQTWWKHMPHFTDYLARCGFMLGRGRPVADVLWYLGDDLDHKPRQDQAFPNGYRFDYLNADVLLNRLSVRDGDLTIPEGSSWRVIWLPSEQCSRLTPATLGKLKALIEAGATVIGEPPQINPSLSGGAEADRKFAIIVKELWGDKMQQRGDRKLGKGRLLWGEELAPTLVKLGIEQDVVGARSATWIHRRDGDSDIYFVAADRESPLNANLRFRAQGVPEFWDPLTGKIAPIAVFQQDQSGTTIPMQLPAAGSVFVVFRPGVPSAPFEQIAINGQPWLDATDAKRVDTVEPYPHFGLPRQGVEIQPWIEPAPLLMDTLPGTKQFVAWTDGDYQFTRPGVVPQTHKVTGTRSIPVNAGWSLSFPSGWDAPANLDLGELKPWSELEDKATRHFSGSATYRTTVRLEDLKPDERLLLDLGRVANIAEVRINGHKAAVLWTAPFRIDITEDLKAGENRIEIEVTNTWHNRLAYDASLPKSERKTWTISGTKADSPLKLAGLEGPVQVRVGKMIYLNAN